MGLVHLHVVQVVAVTMVVLLVNIATVSSNTIANFDTTRTLLSFEDFNQLKSRESNELLSNEEERGLGAVIGGAAVGNQGTTPDKQKDGGKTETVTKYSNNGVWQRFVSERSEVELNLQKHGDFDNG
ncbi:hypothetical protein PHMEG_0003873 [Phytophthora megakarya]|uniref:RxLR effector protein n=1 Tax=Phytophthora megakarya TaxID=4795 RepID=A0A225WWX1_9STRA|nr:hypothetical protein PHMEG_0003873 [Phytophthora megakarya]